MGCDYMKLMTGDGVVFLRPMEESLLQEATMLYKSSIGYVTGLKEAASARQIRDTLFSNHPSSDEFSSGIFISCDNTPGMQFVGLVTGLVRGNKIWLKLLAILPQFQRRGIGTRTAKLILEYCRKYWGVTEAFLSVAQENGVGLRFWSSQGFLATISFKKALLEEEIKQKVIIMNKKCI